MRRCHAGPEAMVRSLKRQEKGRGEGKTGMLQHEVTQRCEEAVKVAKYERRIQQEGVR